MTVSSGAASVRAEVVHVDGCAHCGNRTAVSPAHVEQCSGFYKHRRAARAKAEQFGISAVCVDDLFAHLSTPRLGGALCTPATAAEVVGYIAALGWRPVVGVRAPEQRQIETREATGGVL